MAFCLNFRLYSGAMVRTVVIIMLTISAKSTFALPAYTARSGRICDNCHMTPFEYSKQKAWVNPALKERKCNLSCQTCHTDPSGSGLRTSSGRYYARSTLAIFNWESRPYWDYKRNITDIAEWFRSEPERKPAPKKQPEKPTAKKPVPKQNKPDRNRYHQAPPVYSFSDFASVGTALNANPKKRTYVPDFGIFGRQNADPFFNIGGNFRMAYIHDKSTDAFFPMQADLAARIHPVEHFSVAGTVGVLGKTGNLSDTKSLSVADRLALRSAYLMLHELPYQAFVRTGAFMPGFGIRTDDHTSFTRKHFEMDTSKRYNSVAGIETGFAANYPYATVSVFSNNVGALSNDPSQNFKFNLRGFGAAVTGGWRDLLWGAGTSFMVKQRPREFNGNLAALGFDYYFNVGRLKRTLPIVIQGEFAFGKRTNTVKDRTFQANFIEFSYLVFNGVNLKLNHHFYDADFTIKNDESGRLGTGIEITPWPFFRMLVEHRWNWSIDPSKTFRESPFINPYDLLVLNQWVLIAHFYF